MEGGRVADLGGWWVAVWQVCHSLACAATSVRLLDKNIHCEETKGRTVLPALSKPRNKILAFLCSRPVLRS